MRTTSSADVRSQLSKSKYVEEVASTAAARRAFAAPMQVALAALALVAGDPAENPYRVGKASQAPLDGLHSARRGDDRILYGIDGQLVTVLDVEHRRDACRS